MIRVGKGTRMEGVKIIGNNCEMIIGNNVTFGVGVTIHVTERLEIGDRSVIGNYFEISGRWIKIGREFWSGKHCTIGGGSCFEKNSKLEIGDFVHLGDGGIINTARPVKIGNEVGLGQDTRIYTHGAYLSFLKGFPVEFGSITIEDRVWCPKAIIMPNVTIGHDAVVGAGAIVIKNLPSGCLAVGIPAKVIKENYYPKQFSRLEYEELIAKFIKDFKDNILTEKDKVEIRQIGNRVFVGSTLFDLGDMKIDGQADEYTEKFKNELRRYGVRFKYYVENGIYIAWS